MKVTELYEVGGSGLGLIAEQKPPTSFIFSTTNQYSGNCRIIFENIKHHETLLAQPREEKRASGRRSCWTVIN